MDSVRVAKYYSRNEHFEICNPNPVSGTKRGLRWDRPDCTVRALANSTGCSWVEAFDWLCGKAKKDYTMPNDGSKIRDWYKESGAEWVFCKAVKGKKRMTVLEFAESHPEGRYVVDMAGHHAACVDGKILDTWNCGDKAVVGYYDMKRFSI